jgi:hypothetical protein
MSFLLLGFENLALKNLVGLVKARNPTQSECLFLPLERWVSYGQSNLQDRRSHFVKYDNRCHTKRKSFVAQT